MVISDSGS